jgi:phosphoglycolate phosphatase
MSNINGFIGSFNLVIFDLDGTLIDSHDQIESAMNEARIELGYRKSPTGQIFEKLGQPVNDLFSDLQLSPTLQEQLVFTFRNYLNKKIEQNNSCFPSVIDLLKLFRANETKIAIATSKQTLMAKSVINNSLLSGQIDYVQGTDGFAPKPNPEVIQICLNKFPGSQAIMIGDRTEDMFAAKNAGIPSIGVAQTAHSASELERAGAIFTFQKIADFYQWARN